MYFDMAWKMKFIYNSSRVAENSKKNASGDKRYSS